MSSISGGWSIPTTSYLFVDGAYLRARLTCLARRYFQGELPDMDYGALWKRFGAEKIFYFDCDPPKRKGEADEDHGKRVEAAKAIFSILRRLPGCHIILGDTKPQKQKGEPEKQKGVDVQLAVQALMHVFRRNTRVVTLLTGDLDFKPLVEALVLEGAYVTLAYEKRTTAQELIDAADAQHVLWPHDLMRYTSASFREKHSVPNVSTLSWGGDLATDAPPHGLTKLWTRTCSAGQAALCMGEPQSGSPMRTLLCPVPGEQGTYWQIAGPDEELLKKLVEDI